MEEVDHRKNSTLTNLNQMEGKGFAAAIIENESMQFSTESIVHSLSKTSQVLKDLIISNDEKQMKSN